MGNPVSKFRYIVGLSFLEIGEPLGKGDQIVEGFRITNDKAVIRKFMTSELTKSLGGLEGDALLNADAWIYCESQKEGYLNPDDAINLLFRMLQMTAVFSTSLWLVKDNAMNFELGFLEVWLPDGGHRAHSNFLAMAVAGADGLRPKVKFTRNEVREARVLFWWLMSFVIKEVGKEVETPIKMPDGLQPMLSSHANVPRLRRAFYFLESARSFRDVGMKIAMYCSLFETLFSTDATEITHKIAHRIAIFLERDMEMRCNLFSRIKRAYGIRSKVIHGDEVKQDDKTILAVCVDVDEIARRILVKIGTSEKLRDQFRASKSAMDEYFLKESFGGLTDLKPKQEK